MGQSNQQAKLCPHCANSIALDAVKCPYCKAQLTPLVAPQWAERADEAAETIPVQSQRRAGASLKIVTVAAVVLFAVGGVFVLSYWPRGERPAGVSDSSAELREKQQKIETLEAELAKLREGNQGSSRQFDELRAKLSESEKDLAEAEKKLADANREIERLTASRTASLPRAGLRSDAAPPPPPAPITSRRTAEPGVYETVRATTVYEEPAGSARVLTQIGRGTRVNVVRSLGEWLEVRSKHGNPPGFIRTDDAMLVGKAN